MDRQRSHIAELVRMHFGGATLTRSRADLALLQQVVDAALIPRDQTWALQALGVVFGDALAAMQEGLAWCEVTDEFGTDPTLRFRATSVQVNALTTISKRVERSAAVDVSQLAEQILTFLRTRAEELG
jgi:hypothetical protein